MLSFFSSLWPSKATQTKISGSLFLILALLLSVVTGFFVLTVLLARTYLPLASGGTEHLPLEWRNLSGLALFAKPFWLTLFLIAAIPLGKWWGQTFVLSLCLRSPKAPPPAFSLLLFARAFSLLPILLLLPLKALTLPLDSFLSNLFFPILSSLALSLLSWLQLLPSSSLFDLLVWSKLPSALYPNVGLSLLLFLLSFVLFARKIRPLCDLPLSFLLWRSFFAFLLWDLLSAFFLLASPWRV